MNNCNCCKPQASSGAGLVLIVGLVGLVAAWGLSSGKPAARHGEAVAASLQELSIMDSASKEDRELANVVARSFQSDSVSARSVETSPPLSSDSSIIRLTMPASSRTQGEWHGFASGGEGAVRWN